ncbi:MAG: D-3-phosphoglycerate dehydrogenase / 2-oxoglutarate reductase [Hyphomicrobiales bacterium]|jgi:D-3-phosphoglycerate dehydrogenase|nr:D-3-phosphoglycerate dehydrogenase / 2-oxoglutarate reductase [Hyphomicrobiales bacterium]
MPARFKAVRTDRELECPDIDAGLRAAGCELVLLPEGIGENELIAAVHDADLLLMCYTPITARVIAAADKLKGIVKYGVGIDAIDIAAAMARGIPVVNVPEYAEETVAEGAFALMIALAKKLMPIGREMVAKGWAWPTPQWMGLDLAGRTLGLIGTGKIGRSMARMAAGFRMRVVGFDPHVSAETMRAGGIEKIAGLHALLAASDVVSIHAVLNDETRHLIGGLELGLMKPSAFLINVSRGAIVDEAALVLALREKVIAGAALDVYSREPVAHSGHPMSALYGQDNVILFPHLTFYTAEAMARLTEDTLARSREILEGRPVLVKSNDPRLRAQRQGVVFGS